MGEQKKVIVLGTGGTIAGRAASAGDYHGYTAGQVGIEDLLAAVPPLQGSALVGEQVAQLDSKDMDYPTWVKLAQRCQHWLAQADVAGLVITHGTDTLEETAYFLHSVLNANKPVVLTCAMRPATALVPDGPQNLWDAVTLARAPGWAGAAVICAGAAHHALEVQKAHTYRLDAFSSGDAGPIAYVEQAQVRWLRKPTDGTVPAGPSATNTEPLGFNPGWAATALANMTNMTAHSHWPRVELLLSHAGASAAMVDALLAHPGASPLAGLVVAGTGSGTVHVALEQALTRAQAQGVLVWRSTRCASGRSFAKAQEPFDHAPFGLSAVKARLALVLHLLAR